MKTKTFRYGNISCRTYLKSVGHGWETAFVFDGRTVFLGNFVNSSEASRWYGIMNREIARFGKKYTVGVKFPVSWFKNFISNHLHRFYYAFLDKIFAKKLHHFDSVSVRDIRNYRRMKKNFSVSKKIAVLKVA